MSPLELHTFMVTNNWTGGSHYKYIVHHDRSEANRIMFEAYLEKNGWGSVCHLSSEPIVEGMRF